MPGLRCGIWVTTWRRGTHRSPSAGLAKLPLHHLREQEIESALDDQSEVASRVCVTHQVAREVELLFKASAGGKLNAIALRRERLDACLRGAPLRGSGLHGLRLQRENRVGLLPSAAGHSSFGAPQRGGSNVCTVAVYDIAAARSSGSKGL